MWNTWIQSALKSQIHSSVYPFICLLIHLIIRYTVLWTTHYKLGSGNASEVSRPLNGLLSSEFCPICTWYLVGRTPQSYLLRLSSSCPPLLFCTWQKYHTLHKLRKLSVQGGSFFQWWKILTLSVDRKWDKTTVCVSISMPLTILALRPDGIQNR